jgi:hypothetical protein
MLTPFANRIWTYEADFKVFGLELGGRMTVVDIDRKGSLLIHSPVRLSDELKKDIDALGEVRVVVAPNKWHHLFVGDFKTQYPSAKFYCAPGLEKKRSDFKFDGVISAAQTFPWNQTLEHKLVEGTPLFNEVVFFLPEEKTLIITDLAIHICESQSLITRVVLKMIGAYGKFGWTKPEKKLFIRDKAAFKASLESILRWNFEKIALTHGTPVLADGQKRLREAFLNV